VKNCPATAVPVGGLYVFSGYVTNTGDAILTNVVVFSSQAGQNLPLLGPVDLAPGESQVFGGSYTVTTGSNPTTDIVTASGTEVCRGRIFTAAANSFVPVSPTAIAITSLTLANGMVTVSWTATPGVTYRLQYISNAQNSVWTDVPGDVTASGATASKTDAMGSTQQRFYRVRIVQ